MNNLEIFVLAYTDEQLLLIPDNPYLTKVNLSNLPIAPELQSNLFGGDRIFFTDLPCKSKADYIGLATWRFDDKFVFKNKLVSVTLGELAQTMQPLLQPNVVFCAAPSNNWCSWSIKYHVGMKKYLLELADYTGLSLDEKNVSFWSNQFICHKSVYLEWQEFFTKVHTYFYNKYGTNYDFYVDPWEVRKVGAWYERFALIYFANRRDLIIQKYP